jgi:transcriptional regulator with XRE-family HTH domain
MERKRKVLAAEETSWFKETIDEMPVENKIFVDKSMEIANYILQVMDRKGLKQKDLAERMGKTEAEVSKWLGGMHNFTVRSLAKIEAALGSTIMFVPKNVSVAAPKITTRNKVENLEAKVIKIQPKLQYSKTAEFNITDYTGDTVQDNQLEKAI